MQDFRSRISVSGLLGNPNNHERRNGCCQSDHFLGQEPILLKVVVWEQHCFVSGGLGSQVEFLGLEIT